jgi:hypothetical protein
METGFRSSEFPMVSMIASYRWIWALLLAPSILLQACEPPSPPGNVPGKAPVGKPLNSPGNFAPRPQPLSSAARPATPGKTLPKLEAKKEQPKILMTLDKIDLAGNALELASSIIAANTNPFLSRLPNPDTEVASTSEVTAEAPPQDPFESVALLGIIYNPKNPIALIAEGDEPASLRKNGELLSDGLLKVVNIGEREVTLQKVGTKNEQKTLVLPDIIGFGSAENEPKTSRTGPSNRTRRRFENLNKLQEQPPESGKADVTLQEP